MKNFCSTGTFVALSLLCAGPAVQQSLSASSPVAYVYLQTNEGINVYDASSTGALTLVKGSPFQAGGTWIEADNGKYMFTFDAANNIHTYAIESNGTIGSQVAEVYADADDEHVVGDLLHHADIVLLPKMTIKEAVAMFENAESDALAVVDGPETRHVIGLLTEQHALRRYSEELDRRRRELSGE